MTRPYTVVVYSKPSCVQCTTTKRHLDKLGIEFTPLELADHPDVVAKAKADGHLSAPLVIAEVAGNTYTWAGYRDRDIAAFSTLLTEPTLEAKGA